MTTTPEPPSPTAGPDLPPPDGLAGPMPFRVATTVAPTDTSTSVVLRPGTVPQLENGKVVLRSYSGITYARRRLADGAVLELQLDLQRPDHDGVLPLVVYVPGGAFLMSPKESAPELRRYVAEAGFVVASVQYRTTLNYATYTDGVADVRTAIRFLRAHAGDYGIDPAKAAVWGESAGGYLAAMVGATNDSTRFDTGDHPEHSGDVQAVVDKFGGADLARIAADFDDETREFFAGPGNSIAWYVYGRDSGKSFASHPGEAAQADPATHLSPATPPFLFFHGTDDHLVSPSQTLNLHNTLQAADAESTRYVLDGARHGDLAFLGDFESGLPWSTRQVMGLLVEFLGKHLRD